MAWTTADAGGRDRFSRRTANAGARLEWGKPSERPHGPGKDDEWVIETSYKFQLANNLSLMPDVQLLFNPANNPGESRVLVLGLRMIVVL